MRNEECILPPSGWHYSSFLILHFSFFILYSSFNLQEVVEVTGNVLVEMHAVGTHHVVAITRVGEEVGMRSCVDASTDERPEERRLGRCLHR